MVFGMKKKAKMAEDLQARIMSALRGICPPDEARDIVALGMVGALQVDDQGQAVVTIEVDPAQGAQLEPLRQKAEKAVRGVDGVAKSSVILTAQRKASAPQGRVHGAQRSVEMAAPDPHGMNKNPVLSLPVKKIIAVASGKGGVGKSTVAVNLAVQLAKNGRKVGLLDADIYGPSVPKLTGLEGLKPDLDDEKKIIPPEVFGMKVMSIGFMVDAQKALVWRGPMVQSALYQLFRDVKWGTEEDKLDVLIVDMPPGTGDAQLTLAQKVPVDGAIIVSTPQDIALLDARKGIEMFETTGVPVLGVVENMSTHICSNCGHEEHIFGHGGAADEARALGVPFLGEIPLHIDIRKSADGGKPVACGDSALAQAYAGIVGKV